MLIEDANVANVQEMSGLSRRPAFISPTLPLLRNTSTIDLPSRTSFTGLLAGGHTIPMDEGSHNQKRENESVSIVFRERLPSNLLEH
jgi:hypothetical protein